jgi:hypothetical protein
VPITFIVLDTGADCCLFPEWVALRVGLRRTTASPVVTLGSSLSQSGTQAWFDRVELQVADPAGIAPAIRWSAVVGFAPYGSFMAGAITGVLGGLDRFQRIEFDWSALGGPEVVLRT